MKDHEAKILYSNNVEGAEPSWEVFIKCYAIDLFAFLFHVSAKRAVVALAVIIQDATSKFSIDFV